MSNCKGCGVRWNYKPDHLDYCAGCANGKLQIATESLGVIKMELDKMKKQLSSEQKRS